MMKQIACVSTVLMLNSFYIIFAKAQTTYSESSFGNKSSVFSVDSLSALESGLAFALMLVLSVYRPKL